MFSKISKDTKKVAKSKIFTKQNKKDYRLKKNVQLQIYYMNIQKPKTYKNTMKIVKKKSKKK